MEKEKQGLAVTSFVLSLLGLFFAGLIFGILAIVFGSLSWERGLGKAGLFIGIFDIVAVLLFLSVV